MSEKEELKELEIEAAKIGMQCYESFYFFFITFWDCMSGDEYIDAPHIKYICDVIQEKAMKVVNKEVSMETLIINVPPGSSKSTIATIAFPMWIWLRAPWLASTNVSYSATLSERHAKKARAIGYLVSGTSFRRHTPCTAGRAVNLISWPTIRWSESVVSQWWHSFMASTERRSPTATMVELLS